VCQINQIDLTAGEKKPEYFTANAFKLDHKHMAVITALAAHLLKYVSRVR